MSRGPRPGAFVRTSLTPIALFACLAALVASLPLWRGSAAGAKPDEKVPKAVEHTTPAGKARAEVIALARLEPEAGIINVGARPGARVVKLAVKEGDQVADGATLAVLEGHDQAELQVKLAEAQKKNADHQRALGRDKLAVEREREDALKKDRIEAQEKLVDVTKRRLKAATEIYQKVGKPLQDNALERHQLDLGYYQAEAEATKAQVELRELHVAQDLTKKRRDVEDRSLADNGPDSVVLDRQIDLARSGLEQTTVLSPGAGRVLAVTSHAGEASSGAIVSLGDVSSMVAVAEVYQADIPEVKVGDPADVVILGRKVAGKVTRISRMVGKNALASLDPRALQDRRVVAVTIRLDDPAAAADYVNMEVEVAIRSQHGGAR